MTITIQDETFAGGILRETTLSFASETTTVRDIITRRVEAEVAAYNARQGEYFTGLVAPSEAEATLNGYRMRTIKPVDAEKQVYVALDAFQQNGYFVMIDTLQAESLEQEVVLRAHTIVSFIKLIPLIGG